jgi:hypothetical protein
MASSFRIVALIAERRKDFLGLRRGRQRIKGSSYERCEIAPHPCPNDGEPLPRAATSEKGTLRRAVVGRTRYSECGHGLFHE